MCTGRELACPVQALLLTPISASPWPDLAPAANFLGFLPSSGARRFGFIGSPLPCLNACTAQGANNVLASPNYNAEADGMASIIAHETMEVSTDPLINAWCAAFPVVTTQVT